MNVTACSTHDEKEKDANPNTPSGMHTVCIVHDGSRITVDVLVKHGSSVDGDGGDDNGNAVVGDHNCDPQ